MLRDNIELLFQKLLLTERSTGTGQIDHDLQQALARARRLLQADVEAGDQAHFELRLRLALHLSPAEAIEYDATRPVPRRRLIADYIHNSHRIPEPEAKDLAHAVARVLRSWEERREAVHGYTTELLVKQRWRCASCRVDLRLDHVGAHPSLAIRNRDEFKPIFLSPEELLTPEVDHIEPVSKLGDNDESNLQVLCRFCNSGKSDRLGVDTRTEAAFAGKPIESIPRALRASVFYYVVTRGHHRCSLCFDGETELTIRKVNPHGGYLRSNLYVACTVCAFGTG